MSFISVATRFAGFLACAALLGTSPCALAVPGVFIYYSPSTIVQGGNSVLGIEFIDQDGAGFTGGFVSPAAFTYPAQVINTGVVSSNSCTGSVVTANPGASTFSVSGVSVAPPPAQSFCVVEIQVSTSAAGSYPTTFPVAAFSASTGANATPASATLAANQAYLVTNTNDSGTGSLRDAITQANYPFCDGLVNIQFAIPGTGPFTIRPLTQLPALFCPNMTIDGSTQPGFVPNSNAADGNDSAIQIALDGSLCTGGCDGLELNAPSVFVRGLAIYSFAVSGIAVGTGSASIYGNYIGTDPGGVTARGNATAGVTVLGGFANVGSSAAQDRNLISANATGVWIGGNGTASIENNQVGGKRDGSAGNGNTVRGILFNLVAFSSSNVNLNHVRYNGGAGIVVDSGTTGRVTISGNSSFANGGPGIDFNDDGPTVNTPTDTVIDYPVITQVVHSGTDTIITGTLSVPEAAGVFNGAPATIELYHNSAAGSQTEGERLVDLFSVRLDATGFTSFTRTIPGFLADNVSAATTVDTCGDGCVHSSEYSPKVAVINPPGVPTAVTATGGDALATVSFTPPASNGGSTITGYLVTSIPGGLTATGTGSPITIGGLTNGTSYTFTVTAINAVGSGPASAPSNAVTPVAPAPAITLTPDSLGFATRSVFTTSPAQTVTLTNNGPGTLTISSITIGGDFAFTSTCTTTLAAGATCTLDVMFTPIASGARTGAVSIVSNATGSPHTIGLSGTGQGGVTAILQVLPSVGDFGVQPLGAASAPQTFVITNVGNATLTFAGISVTGAGFALLPTLVGPTSYQVCGAAIQSGAVCAVQVTFTPPAAGSFSGTLTVAGNASNSPLAVGLLGSGAPAAPSRALSVPSSIAFGDQAVGTVSAGHAATIANNSAATVSISELSAGGDFSVSDTCTTIPAHSSCAPLVTFAPNAIGLRTGTLTVRALSEATPYLIDLTGNGVFSDVPQVSLSVTRLGFGNTLIGAPVTAHVILTNVGTVPVNLQSVLARAQFLVSHSCPFTIPLHGTCDITIGFFPNMVGSVVGIVEIVTNAAGSPHDVQVSGVGCAIPSLARARSGQPICGQ